MHEQSQLVMDFYKSQNPMLIQNWKRVVTKSAAIKPFLACARFQNGVVSICNYDILIRLPAPGVPDGFYQITEERLPEAARIYYWIGYPDVQTAVPNLDYIMVQQPPFMDNQVIGDFLSFVASRRGADRSRMVIQLNQECAVLPATVHSPEETFNFPFGLKHPLQIHLDDLEMALRECLRYSHICWGSEGIVSEQFDYSEALAPLFIGGWLDGKLSWDHCVLIKPYQSSYRINRFNTGLFPKDQ